MLNISLANSKFFQQLLSSFFNNQPAAVLIRTTARQQWRLIAANLLSNVSQAFCEASTLGVMFLAVEVLSAPSIGFNWNTTPLEAWPPAVVFLNKISGTTLFLMLFLL